MATYLIRFPATATFTIALFAAVLVAAIALMLRKRSVISRIRILGAMGLCLLALTWGVSSLRSSRFAHWLASHRRVAALAGAPPAPAGTAATTVSLSTRALDLPRAVYGHSIVKGGIHSLAELLDVIARDPLAAQHYKGFDISRARFIRLDHNIMAYVSYRVDGAGIYWTSHPVLIMAGEEVITDGTNYIRARCGNVISYSQQAPVSPDEPSDTDTIVAYVAPPAPPPAEFAEDYSSVEVPLTTTQSETVPPASPSEGPSTNYLPPPMYFPPPPSVTNVDEFAPHGAFYSLLGAILLLFVVEKLRR